MDEMRSPRDHSTIQIRLNSPYTAFCGPKPKQPKYYDGKCTKSVPREIKSRCEITETPTSGYFKVPKPEQPKYCKGQWTTSVPRLIKHRYGIVKNALSGLFAASKPKSPKRWDGNWRDCVRRGIKCVKQWLKLPFTAHSDLETKIFKSVEMKMDEMPSPRVQ